MNRYEELRFILTVRNYAVLDAWPVNIGRHDPDWPTVAMIFQTRPGEHMQRIIDMMNKDSIRTIFINESIEHKDPYLESKITVYYPESVPVSEWMERLKVICVRKRGPKKEAIPMMVIA